MYAVEKVILAVIFVVQITFSNGKPLFVNHTFITSLLAASSGSGSANSFQDNPLSENIAIVPPKPQKLEETTSDTTFYFPEETTDITTTSSEAPSLLQRKVDKILRKIVTVAQIKQALSGGFQDNNSGFQYPHSPDLDEKDIRISKEYGAPLRIDLTNRKEAIEERKDNHLENKMEGKVEPATLGVFLLEVFASLIGLGFGAAAQINNSLSAQNNTL